MKTVFVALMVAIGQAGPVLAQFANEHRRNVEAYLSEENRLTRAKAQRMQDFLLEATLTRLGSFETLRHGPEPCELQTAAALRKPDYLWSVMVPPIVERVNPVKLARYRFVTNAVRAEVRRRPLSGPALDAFIDAQLAQMYVNETTPESRRIAFAKDEQSLKTAVNDALMAAFDRIPHCECPR